MKGLKADLKIATTSVSSACVLPDVKIVAAYGKEDTFTEKDWVEK
jgi:hypothetical protein